MNTVIERVEFQAVSPKKALPGLEYSLNRLEALSAALKRMQSQIAGLSNNTLFKLSSKQFQDLSFNNGKPVLKTGTLTKRLGFGSDVVKDVKDAARLMVAEIQKAQAAINREIDNNPALGKRALAARRQQIAELSKLNPFTTTGSFKDTLAAGRFFGGGLADPAKMDKDVAKFFKKFSDQARMLFTRGYAPMALANKNLGEQATMAILTGGGVAGPMIPGSSITPSHLTKAVQEAMAGAKAESGKAESGKSKKGKGQKAPSIEGDDIIETRTTTPKDEKKPLRTVVKRSVGNGVIEETVHENDEEVKTTVTDAIGKRAKAALNDELKSVKQNLGRGLAAARRQPRVLRMILGDTEAKLTALFDKYDPLGLGHAVTSFRRDVVPPMVGKYDAWVDKNMGSLDRQRQKAQTQSFLATQSGEQAARIAQDRERMRNLQQAYHPDWIKNFSSPYAEKSLQAQAQISRARTAALAQAYQPDWLKKFGAPGAGAATPPPLPKTRLQKAIGSFAPAELAASTLKVTSWAAAVTALYKTVELAKYSLERLVTTGAETAHLGVVFKGVGGNAQQLTADIIGLTAAQGRETSEMMESATEWARLGGDRKAINEEVRVSAMAANIANMHTSETTKQLASLMHIYNQEGSDLNGMLGQLTNTSLKYNVTLEDLFQGLDRSAGAARVAGVDFSELQAMIGTVVGKTGQSGIIVGNTIKSLLVKFSDPDFQKVLRGHGIEPLQLNKNSGELEQKPGGQLLAEMSAKADTMDDRSKMDLLRNWGGRLNAARSAALLDNYLQTQKLMIDAQLNLNKAQDANGQILNTMRAQLAGVRAEFDKLIVTLGNQKLDALFGLTPVQAMTAGLRVGGATVGAVAKNAEYYSNIAGNMFFPRAGLVGGASAMVLQKTGVANGIKLALTSDPQGAFENRVQQLHEEASARKSLANNFYAFAAGKLDRGTMTHSDAHMATYGMGAPQASAFTKAYQSGDRAGAKKILEQAQAEQLAKAATLEQQEAREYNRNIITKKMEAAQIRRDGGPEAKAEELDSEVQHLGEKAREAKLKLEELSGEIEDVWQAQEQYVKALKATEEVQQRLGRLATQSPARTAVGELRQQAQGADWQLAAVEQALRDNAGMKNSKNLEEQGMWKQLDARRKELEAQKFAATDPANRALAQFYDQRTVRNHELENGGNYGGTETDKLANQQRYLENIVKNSKNALDVQTAQNLLLNNSMDIQLRRIDVEREIKQLAIDQNKEFAKSFLGAGPAEMLRKLTAFRMAKSGSLSQGQMFSLSPAMRQDYGLLTGNNFEMGQLNYERNKLNAMTTSDGGAPVTVPFGALKPAGNGNAGVVDTLVIKGCEAALTSLSGVATVAAAAMQRAFADLENRVDALFVGGSTGGLQFAPSGQSGGWYPGKTK